MATISEALKIAVDGVKNLYGINPIADVLKIAMDGIDQGNKTVSYYNQNQPSSDTNCSYSYSASAEVPRSIIKNKLVIVHSYVLRIRSAMYM